MFCCKRLYLDEVAVLLRKKKTSTAKKWCVKHNVPIFYDEPSPYVIKAYFDIAYDGALLEHLLKKHGDDWEEHYQLIRDDKYYSILSPKQSNDVTKSTYTPKSKTSIKFLSQLQ